MAASLFVSIAALAAPAAPPLQVIQLKNGFNLTPMEGLRDNTFVTIAHLDNHDAHSYDMTIIYSDLHDPHKPWPTGLQIVPLREKSGAETRSLFTEVGTKCMPEDYRMVGNTPDHRTWLIVAKRAAGKSPDAKQAVTFTYYRLTTADKRVAGTPPVEFRYFKSQVSRHHYCSVETAFQKELGLGAYRIDLSK